MQSIHASVAPAAENRRALALLFAAALAVRLVLIFALGTPRAVWSEDPWEFGHESACLAQSLSDGGSFGDPWNHDTGPSSWLTPPYPALVALVLELAPRGPAVAGALFVLQALLSAATAVLVARSGSALGRPRAGLLGGWLFACYPPAIWNAIEVVWDTTLVAFGVALFTWVFLRALRSGRLAGYACAGAVLGLLLFTNPAPVTMVPGALAAIALAAASMRAAAVRALVLVGVAFALCLPWMLRNQRVLGTLALRPNFGVEMYLGNNDTSEGRPVPMRYHPSHVPAELQSYRELGEVGYAAHCWQRARTWIAEHPGRFAALTLRRIQYVWVGDPPFLDPRREGMLQPKEDWKAWVKFLSFGLAGLGALAALFVLDCARPARVFLTAGVLLFGIPYFVTHVSERYRFPIDPLVLLLDAWLLVRLLERRGRPAA